MREFLKLKLTNSKKPSTFATPFEKGTFFDKILGVYQSGQMGQTVNLLAYAYGGSNPSAPTKKVLAGVAHLVER